MPPTSAQHRAAGHHHEGELQVMHHDLPVGEAEGFQDGDLLPLQRQQPRQHRVGHERRHAQEHDREADGNGLQHADFVRDPDVGRMVGAAIGAPPAVRRQQAVQLGDDRPLGRAGRQRQRRGS